MNPLNSLYSLTVQNLIFEALHVSQDDSFIIRHFSSTTLLIASIASAFFESLTLILQHTYSPCHKEWTRDVYLAVCHLYLIFFSSFCVIPCFMAPRWTLTRLVSKYVTDDTECLVRKIFELRKNEELFANQIERYEQLVLSLIEKSDTGKANIARLNLNMMKTIRTFELKEKAKEIQRKTFSKKRKRDALLSGIYQTLTYAFKILANPRYKMVRAKREGYEGEAILLDTPEDWKRFLQAIQGDFENYKKFIEARKRSHPSIIGRFENPASDSVEGSEKSCHSRKRANSLKALQDLAKRHDISLSDDEEVSEEEPKDQPSETPDLISQSNNIVDSNHSSSETGRQAGLNSSSDSDDGRLRGLVG